MAVRAQMDQNKLRKLNPQSVESTTNESTTYMVIQSPMEKLLLVVTQFLFHAFSTGAMQSCAMKPSLYSNFRLPQRCDIMEYSSIRINFKLILLFHEIKPSRYSFKISLGGVRGR